LIDWVLIEGWLGVGWGLVGPLLSQLSINPQSTTNEKRINKEEKQYKRWRFWVSKNILSDSSKENIGSREIKVDRIGVE
jgi:hypothetical protein